jgi:hypothetical protein
MTKMQVITKIENLGGVTAQELENFKKEKLSLIVIYYQTLLTNLIKPLGMPSAVVDSLSIEKLETLAQNFISNVKVAQTDNKNRKASGRQIAVINAVNSGAIEFPISAKEFKNIICGFYAIQYFDLKGNIPTNFQAVETLAIAEIIETLDGVDIKTALTELEKNGNFAGANSYSPKHRLSTFNSDVFPFTLTRSKTDGLIHYALK